jgi:predicted nuclease of predicted toxin-antitoxin system
VAIPRTAGQRQLNERFLIDECLSGRLVAAAKARGFQADYVTHLGKAGWQDWNLVRFAVANDYIVVTDNRRDFLKEYARLDIHAGLVILIPKGTRSQQITLFQKALDVFAARNDDLVNKVMEVHADGTVHVREWNAVAHDIGHIGNPKR